MRDDGEYKQNHGPIRLRRGYRVRQEVREDGPEGAVRPYLKRVNIPADTSP